MQVKTNFTEDYFLRQKCPNLIDLFATDLTLRHGGEHGVQSSLVVRHEPDLRHSSVRLLLLAIRPRLAGGRRRHRSASLVHQPDVNHQVEALLVELG